MAFSGAEQKIKTLDFRGDPLLRADLMSETLGGGTNVAAALGNGRLSVGISPWGELTYFRWPFLSYHDHLRYFTHYELRTIWDGIRITVGGDPKPKDMRWGIDAPSRDWRRHGRPLERYHSIGSCAGILPTGTKNPIWLNDPVWNSDRRYANEDSCRFITTLACTLPGKENLSVRIEDWIDPEHDSMVRVHTISPGATRFFYHATFAPWLGRIKSPLANLDPKDAGFAAIYLTEEDVILHFRPRKPDAKPLKKRAPDIWTPEVVDESYPDGGVFIAWAFMDRSENFQVGADSEGHKLPKGAPIGGRADANDGTLQGNPIFIGPVDAALSHNLGNGGEVAVLIGVGDSASKAVDEIKRARRAGLNKLRKQVDKHWKARISDAYFPRATDANTRRVSKRSLLTILMSQDAATGAIVASPARQPLYNFDFPRDDAFIDLALDIAGFTKAVDRHIEFLSKVQLQSKLSFSIMLLVSGKWPFYNASGHYRAWYSTDGTGGIFAQPFEIDSTALTIWNLWRHDMFVPKERRNEYRDMVFPVIKKGADAIAKYVNVRSKWVRPAFEDDAPRPTATMHGATSVLTGLMSAWAASTSWGMSDENTSSWKEKAGVLRQGMLARIENTAEIAEMGWRGLHWALWPSPLFESNDPRADPLIASLSGKLIERSRKGFAYLGEQALALALAPRLNEKTKTIVRTALDLLVNEVAFPGSEHFGEVALYGDFTGTGRKEYQNRTAIPHLWTSALVYLVAVALHEPELLMSQRPPIPENAG